MLGGLYLAIFMVLALYDPPLQPAVAEFLKVPASTVTDAENAYFALLGFAAPAGSDIREYGRTSYRSTLERAAKQRAQGGQPLPQLESGTQMAFKGKELPNERFYQFVVGSPEVLDRMASDNRELLDRYRTLRQYPRIFEPSGEGHFQDVPIPSFAPVRSTQSLWLLLALRQSHQGNADQALRLLADDLAYWRSIVPQSHMLIIKLIAIACIQRDYQVLSELIGHAALSGTQRAQVRAMLPPWQAGDVQFSESLRYEALFLTDALFASLAQHGPFDRLLLKKNATRNSLVRIQMTGAELAGLSADRFYREASASAGERRIDVRLKLDFLYNPVGAILASISTPQYAGYCAKGHELEAKRRMVLIHLLAREQGIGPDGMDSFLPQLGKEYRNPYTNQPMGWDAGKKSIVMDSIPAQGKAERRRVELAL
jgi:hypothetical protein